jgi:hypothetical protein
MKNHIPWTFRLGSYDNEITERYNGENMRKKKEEL